MREDYIGDISDREPPMTTTTEELDHLWDEVNNGLSEDTHEDPLQE